MKSLTSATICLFANSNCYRVLLNPLLIRSLLSAGRYIGQNGSYSSVGFFHRCSALNSKIKIVQPDPKKAELDKLGYEDRNERMKRALSPHLTIYSPQLTSMLSISQRISGMALTVYTWALGIGALLTSHDIQHFITMIEGLELNGTCLTVGKLILSVPLTFHFWNSFRHLLWSFGHMLHLNLVYTTGYMVLAMTPLSALVVSLLG